MSIYRSEVAALQLEKIEFIWVSIILLNIIHIRYLNLYNNVTCRVILNYCRSKNDCRYFQRVHIDGNTEYTFLKIKYENGTY